MQNKKETISERCFRTHVQDCGSCERLDCCDNLNTPLQQIQELEKKVVSLYEVYQAAVELLAAYELNPGVSCKLVGEARERLRSVVNKVEENK